MRRRLRLACILTFALVCLSLPAAPSRAVTANRVFLPMISTLIPADFVYSAVTSDGTGDVYTLSRDGKTRRLTNTPDVSEFSPTWSPDRTRIAYVAYDVATQRRSIAIVWLTHPETPTVVLNVDPGQTSFSDMEWSPDGERFAFVAGFLRERAIYTVKVDGTDLRRVTDFYPYNCVESPTWSPDGSKIAFAGDPRCTGSVDFLYGYLYVINADGTHRIQLTGDSEYGHYAAAPAWSPDGTRIAFRFGIQICTIRPDGTDRKVITTGAGYYGDFLPNWSPDSNYIVFYRQDFKLRFHMIVEAATGREIHDFPVLLPFVPIQWAR